MSVHFSDLATKAALDGKVSPEEVLALRQLGWADGRMSQAEAEAIFRLNDEVDSNNSQWVDFFVEAIGEYVVNQREPRGYVDADNAIWLIQMIDADGKLCTMAELELLLRVFERAKNVPDRLKTYAVEKVEQAVLTGVGPTRDGGALQAGNVNATEAKLLRRAIFAPASERPAAVGQREAEMLFRLKSGACPAAPVQTLFSTGTGQLVKFVETEGVAADEEVVVDGGGVGDDGGVGGSPGSR